MRYKRADRISRLLQERISAIVARKIKDPLVQFVTITAVRVTNDLKYARVYVRVVGDRKKRESALKGLGRATGFVRAELSQVTQLKCVPQLEFLYDESIDYADHIETLLNQLKQPNDDAPSK